MVLTLEVVEFGRNLDERRYVLYSPDTLVLTVIEYHIRGLLTNKISE